MSERFSKNVNMSSSFLRSGTERRHLPLHITQRRSSSSFFFFFNVSSGSGYLHSNLLATDYVAMNTDRLSKQERNLSD